MPRFKYALLTNDYTDGKYGDIPVGSFRPINLDSVKPQVKALDLYYGSALKRTILYTNPNK
jgi:hypothetical protein